MPLNAKVTSARISYTARLHNMHIGVFETIRYHLAALLIRKSSLLQQLMERNRRKHRPTDCKPKMSSIGLAKKFPDKFRVILKARVKQRLAKKRP